jgi:transposase-like protein
MGRTLKVILTNEQRLELEHGYKTGDSHSFRQRCRMVLLKSSNKLTKDICQIVGIHSQNQVNTWIKRYQSDYDTVGISVLHNAEGQGRKPIFDSKTEGEKIKAVVKQERQKLSNAKQILEKELNKSFNIKTLKNFLKVLTADTNDLDVM